jgi:hypothetical protein
MVNPANQLKAKCTMRYTRQCLATAAVAPVAAVRAGPDNMAGFRVVDVVGAFFFF